MQKRRRKDYFVKLDEFGPVFSYSKSEAWAWEDHADARLFCECLNRLCRVKELKVGINEYNFAIVFRMI